mmetsp:Transcript_33941/g.90475  ORF Transcript_33941/g.90475 Transcript_33941/m.90475 type:complete len:153 (+) Transcript_33941:595-1053(+)
MLMLIKGKQRKTNSPTSTAADPPLFKLDIASEPSQEETTSPGSKDNRQMPASIMHAVEPMSAYAPGCIVARRLETTPSGRPTSASISPRARDNVRMGWKQDLPASSMTRSLRRLERHTDGMSQTATKLHHTMPARPNEIANHNNVAIAIPES